MDELQLLRPWWLLALLPLAWLLWRGLRRSDASPWRGVIDPHLLPHLEVLSGGGRSRRDLLLIGLLALGVLALAGPAWERGAPVRMQAVTPPLVIALDLSRSMDAADTPPSRLALARLELNRLLEQLSPRPVGLVVFGGAAFRALPMTEDRRILNHTLAFLESGIMPAPGSRPSSALEQALAMLSGSGAGEGDILLVADAAEPAAIHAATAALTAGFRTSVLAVGTAGGGTIPDPEGSLGGKGGESVLAGFDRAGLQAIAEAGEGAYREIVPDDSDTAALLAALHPARAQQSTDPEDAGSAWYDRGPWLIVLLCPLAMLAFRRAGLFALLPLLGLLPQPAPAWEFEELWLNADQRGLRALQAGEPALAFTRFRSPLWRGVAAYRSGDYPEALRIFRGLETPMAHYNRGNTLVRLGEFARAHQAYGRALALDPDHSDARHNRKLLNAFLAPRPQEPPPSASPGQKESAPPQEEGLSEEPLEVPDREQLRKLPKDAPVPPESPGQAGGGAILLEGAPHPEQPDGSTLGQGLGGRGEEQGPRGGEPARGDGEPGTEAAEVESGTAAAPPEPGELSDTAEAAPEGSAATPAGPPSEREQLQALEQWLARIPESGPGFLREKFLREYRRNPPKPPEGAPW